MTKEDSASKPQEKPRAVVATQPAPVRSEPASGESFGYLYWLGSLGFGEKHDRR